MPCSQSRNGGCQARLAQQVPRTFQVATRATKPPRDQPDTGEIAGDCNAWPQCNKIGRRTLSQMQAAIAINEKTTSGRRRRCTYKTRTSEDRENTYIATGTTTTTPTTTATTTIFFFLLLLFFFILHVYFYKSTSTFRTPTCLHSYISTFLHVYFYISISTLIVLHVYLYMSTSTILHQHISIFLHLLF